VDVGQSCGPGPWVCLADLCDERIGHALAGCARWEACGLTLVLSEAKSQSLVVRFKILSMVSISTCTKSSSSINAYWRLSDILEMGT
jgi:hypothetical protein